MATRRTTALTVVGWTLAFVATAAAAPKKEEPRPLRDAIAEFNTLAQKSIVGANEAALTEEEVVAAIRGWIRERKPVPDDVYDTFQSIANTGILPPGASLTYIHRWEYNGYHYDVWWVDLCIKTTPGASFPYRIRDRKLRCWPVEK